MGACVLKNQENIEEFCQKKLSYQVDRNKNDKKCLLVWKLTEKEPAILPWPYKFQSTCCYIVIVTGACDASKSILSKDRTNIELAEMLFGAQFLLLHLSSQKKLMLNKKDYFISIYSFFGDSLESELISRARLCHYVEKLQKYLEFGAGSFCLSTLNQAQPIVLKEGLKEFVNFDSKQYQQAKNHPFFTQQLFADISNIKTKLGILEGTLFFKNFCRGKNKIPFVNIEIEEVNNKKKQKQDDFNLFVCQISQINNNEARKGKNIQSVGHIEDSNILFNSLGINNETQSQRIEEIVKGIYFGTQSASKNYSLLNKKQVQLIVNCCASTCKNWFVNDINYKWLDMPDPLSKQVQYNIQCLIYQVADLASHKLSQNLAVFIHCSTSNGKTDNSNTNSACILIGILMCLNKVGYRTAFETVNKKWNISLPIFMKQQLVGLEKKMSTKSKWFQVYSICSYSQNFPSHIVAKYICEVQNVLNIQGLDDFSKSVYLCVCQTNAKIMVGRECLHKQDYEKYAKEHLRLLSKYEGLNGPCSVEYIDKTFRKQPKIDTRQQILHLSSSINRNAGFKRNQQLVFKYPILRPVWQNKRDDGFYFTVREQQKGAQVIMSKGIDWIGYEEDKQLFLEKILNSYLPLIPQDLIQITISAEISQFQKSIFNS